MLNTARHKVGTVYHTAVADLYSCLGVSCWRFIADLNLIIIVKVLLFIVTVLGFYIWEDKRKMCISVSIFIDSSLYSSRSNNVKFSVSSNQKVNIFLLRYQVVKELVKTVLWKSARNCANLGKIRKCLCTALHSLRECRGTISRALRKAHGSPPLKRWIVWRSLSVLHLRRCSMTIRSAPILRRKNGTWSRISAGYLMKKQMLCWIWVMFWINDKRLLHLMCSSLIFYALGRTDNQSEPSKFAEQFIHL